MPKVNQIRSLHKDSRISHTFIVNDEEVREYLANCTIPAEAKDISLNESLRHPIAYPGINRIEHYITVDGEHTPVQIKDGFPSSLLTFFQFGSLLIERNVLDEIARKPFVSPGDMKRLKNIEREKFVLPTMNVMVRNNSGFRTMVRKAIQDFFQKEHSGNSSLLETLYWLIFQTYNPAADADEYILSQCPHCGSSDRHLEKDKMRRPEYSWECAHPLCKKEIYITDVLRLFEKVNNDTGAEGIVTYLQSAIESFLLIHIMKRILDMPEERLIDQFLFVKDGPLSFGGETANMHKPVQAMINHFSQKNHINLVGVESSGPFVEHAKEISGKLNPGELYLLDNDHIYKYIQIGDFTNKEYGRTSYYSGKMIYKAPDQRVYVLTMPVDDQVTYYSRPELRDLRNVHEVLMSVDKLRCDSYENAIIPVAVANKLISLSNRPGAEILERFARKTMQR